MGNKLNKEEKKIFNNFLPKINKCIESDKSYLENKSIIVNIITKEINMPKIFIITLKMIIKDKTTKYKSDKKLIALVLLRDLVLTKNNDIIKHLNDKLITRWDKMACKSKNLLLEYDNTCNQEVGTKFFNLLLEIINYIVNNYDISFYSNLNNFNLNHKNSYKDNGMLKYLLLKNINIKVFNKFIDSLEELYSDRNIFFEASDKFNDKSIKNINKKIKKIILNFEKLEDYKIIEEDKNKYFKENEILNTHKNYHSKIIKLHENYDIKKDKGKYIKEYIKISNELMKQNLVSDYIDPELEKSDVGIQKDQIVEDNSKDIISEDKDSYEKEEKISHHSDKIEENLEEELYNSENKENNNNIILEEIKKPINNNSNSKNNSNNIKLTKKEEQKIDKLLLENDDLENKIKQLENILEIKNIDLKENLEISNKLAKNQNNKKNLNSLNNSNIYNSTNKDHEKLYKILNEVNTNIKNMNKKIITIEDEIENLDINPEDRETKVILSKLRKNNKNNDEFQNYNLNISNDFDKIDMNEYEIDNKFEINYEGTEYCSKLDNDLKEFFKA